MRDYFAVNETDCSRCVWQDICTDCKETIICEHYFNESVDCVAAETERNEYYWAYMEYVNEFHSNDEN